MERDPISTRPLREIVNPGDRLLPLAVRGAGVRPRESDHDRQRTGSHRTNTPEELASIVGAEVLRRYRVVNHTAHDLSTMLPVIMRYHDARDHRRPPQHPGAGWRATPRRRSSPHDGSLLPLDFCVDLTLNRKREITRLFGGHPIAAHEEGCRSSRQTARSPARGRSRS